MCRWTNLARWEDVQPAWAAGSQAEMELGDAKGSASHWSWETHENLRVSLAGTERCSSWSGRGRWPMTGFSLLDIISLIPVSRKIPRHHFPSMLHRTTVLVLHAKKVPSTGQLSSILTTQHPFFAWGILCRGTHLEENALPLHEWKTGTLLLMAPLPSC